jgi:hypothetical protein
MVRQAPEDGQLGALDFMAHRRLARAHFDRPVPVAENLVILLDDAALVSEWLARESARERSSSQQR